MNVGEELQHSLRGMGFVQLLSLLVFVAGYALALGSFVGATGRKRAGLLALVAAAVFSFSTSPWEHGVLLMALVVGGMGIFIAVVAILSRLLGLSTSQAPIVAEAPDSVSTDPLTAPTTLSMRDEVPARVSSRRRPQTDAAR